MLMVAAPEARCITLHNIPQVVKLFLKRPEAAKDMVSRVLNLATDNADNPDLRDRGFVYWRLLSSDPEKAQKVVLCKKPVIGGNSYSTDETVADTALTTWALPPPTLHTLLSKTHKANNDTHLPHNPQPIGAQRAVQEPLVPLLGVPQARRIFRGT